MPGIAVFDVFCGVGGLSSGLQSAGIAVAGGLDTDESCRFAFENNHSTPFICADVESTSYDDIHHYFSGATVRVLAGCAPCQPFSRMSIKNNPGTCDSRWNLISEFLRLAEQGRPDIVLMENVPRLAQQQVFLDFTGGLRALGYTVWSKVVRCDRYGLPQRRSRLVMTASLHGELPLPEEAGRSTVREAIGHLPPLAAGETSGSDLMHRCAALSAVNMDRMRASKPGGTWKDWPENLRPDCYRRKSGSTFTSVYGRMEWDAPAPTLTTQFTVFGTGRFGHPEQDRALSLREGALLQGFPSAFKFAPPGELPTIGRVARHIGNSVPPLLGKKIGAAVASHAESI